MAGDRGDDLPAARRRLPYYATTQAGLVYAILNTPPVDRIELEAIAQDRATRYASWLEFARTFRTRSALKLVSDTATDSKKFSEPRKGYFGEMVYCSSTASFTPTRAWPRHRRRAL